VKAALKNKPWVGRRRAGAGRPPAQKREGGVAPHSRGGGQKRGERGPNTFVGAANRPQKGGFSKPPKRGKDHKGEDVDEVPPRKTPAPRRFKTRK